MKSSDQSPEPVLVRFSAASNTRTAQSLMVSPSEMAAALTLRINGSGRKNVALFHSPLANLVCIVGIAVNVNLTPTRSYRQYLHRYETQPYALKSLKNGEK